MATFTLAKQTNTLSAGNFFFASEDAARDGFTNLTLNADSFIMNPNFEFSTDFKINAGAGNDTIFTSAGNDIVYGGSGSDIISTGKGQDQLFGGSGNDQLFAGAGNDTLDGGSGNDFLDGGTGNDDMFGGTGNDVLNGGYGNDFINGGAGNDVLTGGSGYDDFFVKLNDGVDTITDFQSGQDQIFLDYAIVSQLKQIPLQTAFDIESALINMDVISPSDWGTVGAKLIFEQSSQTLYFDPDGLTGSAEAVALAHLDGINHLSASDFTYTLAL